MKDSEDGSHLSAPFNLEIFMYESFVVIRVIHNDCVITHLDAFQISNEVYFKIPLQIISIMGDLPTDHKPEDIVTEVQTEAPDVTSDGDLFVSYDDYVTMRERLETTKREI